MNTFDNRQISVGTRLGSMLLDHFFMTMIAMAFFIPGMISGFAGAFTASHEETNADFMGGTLGYISMFGFALYFCKDIFNGRSIAKRILKLQIIDNSTGKVASPLKCFIRNILCVLWPIEVIVAMTNTSRRLGDRIAGTQLVQFDPALEQPKINVGKTLLPVAISYSLMLLLMQAMPTTGMPVKKYSMSSFNTIESKELEKLLNDSLGQYLTADIRVYDTVENEHLKYVSAIARLKKNFLEDDYSYAQLNDAATNLIYSRFSKETFTGQLKFVYQASGKFLSRSTTIGTNIKSKNQQ
jgi:uncharacterized RDD family membrane protein YckC